VQCEIKTHDLQDRRPASALLGWQGTANDGSLQKDWKEGVDQHGRTYYEDSVSGRKQYTKPDSFVTCAANAGANDAAACDKQDTTSGGDVACDKRDQASCNGECRWDANLIDEVNGTPGSCVLHPSGGWCKWENAGTAGRSSHDGVLYTTNHGGVEPANKVQYTHFGSGHWKPHLTADCINNQNCGLHDAQTCHDCDTEQECKDIGQSSTLFVTHHRKYMHLRKWNAGNAAWEQVRYHCKRVGEWGAHTCECTCNGHSPCVVEQNYVLKECDHVEGGYHNNVPHPHDHVDGGTFPGQCNKMLHGNAYPNIPNMQECCNMCTNHPLCGSWEYSSTKMCVLKQGAPVWKAVAPSSSVTVWSGCRAGATGADCTLPTGDSTTEYSAAAHPDLTLDQKSSLWPHTS